MEEQKYILQNQFLRLGFDEQGNLLSMQSPILDIQLFPHPDAVSKSGLTWDLRFQDGSSKTGAWELKKSESSDRGLGISLRSESVEITLDIHLEKRGCTWKAYLTNIGQDILNGMTYTLHGPFAIGPNLRFTYPVCAGWSVPYSSVHPAKPLRLQYPLKAAMQWTSITSDHKGVYIGAHDGIPFYKELLWGMDGDDPTFQIRFPDLMLLSGESIALPDLHLALHGDDWRGGSQIYRSWATGCIATPDVPHWYEKRPSWAWVGLKEQFADTFLHTIDELPDVSEQVSAAGLELIQLTAYTEDGHDTQFPDYIPGDSFGGVEGLQDAVRQIHAAGRKISIYVNGRVVDPASSLDPEDREAWVVRTTPEAPGLTETYGKVTFDVMCPGAAEWRALFTERLAYLVETFDIDGIYIDQVCAARSHPCYASNHDHGRPCLAWARYRTFLQALREHLLSIKPDLFLATEGVNDILGQYFDSMQSHNDWPVEGVDAVEPLHDLYLYTFPEHLFNVGCITGENAGSYYLHLAHLYGSGCDFGIRDWDDLPDGFYKEAKAILDWYEKYHEIFRFGERKSVAVDVQSIQAIAYQDDVLMIVNGAQLSSALPSKKSDEMTLQLELPNGVSVGRVGVTDLVQNQPCQWRREGGRLEIDLPVLPLFGLLVELNG
jgi:hypothetical protein